MIENEEIKAFTPQEEKEFGLRPIKNHLNLYEYKKDATFIFKFFCTGNGGEPNGWIKLNKQLLEIFKEHSNPFIVLLHNKPNENIKRVLLIDFKSPNKSEVINTLLDYFFNSRQIVKNTIKLRKLKKENTLQVSCLKKEIIINKEFVFKNMNSAFRQLNISTMSINEKAITNKLKQSKNLTLEKRKNKNTVSNETNSQLRFDEGFRTEIIKEVLKRDKRLVELAKAKYGTKCTVCKFDFGKTFGIHGAGFIEVHHLEPIANGKRKTTIEDVRPVCSNCHRMIHRGNELLSIKDLKKIINKEK